MDDLLTRLSENLISRVGGPLTFRFMLQPTIAVILGIIDGLRFAREGRSFLLWGGPEDPAERRAQAWATCRSIGKVVILALILEMIYQYMVLGWFYPGEAAIVVLVVALIPYLGVRFLVNTVSREYRAHKHGQT